MKRLFLMVSVGALLTSGLIYAKLYDQRVAEQEQKANSQAAAVQAENGDQAEPALANPLELVLRRTYLCGVKTEEQKELTGETMEQVLAKHRGWEIVSVASEQVILHKMENDIAPSCKENGYFGLSEDGVLTLFNGLPSEQKVIQTFYPINTERMEVSLPKEEVELLKQGIRVRDLAEYNSILSTYGDFQIESSTGSGH
ncbi:intercompartmental signaling factor BofC [Brevibacillus humidisoli]|uniref:BofC C-terminal domain-containing protein n=1 Tax=Brevibacillus humidisoli TaxID=2895522 RepID=UPI001E2D7DEF|nr:BofC C-terminal domain-containing protein [Brevibacillus humidisoli]UFJ39029.1 intercompartmental signaling factor BofC [Brevibacillus humidisoli]